MEIKILNLFLVFLTFHVILALDVHPNDLLSGNGLFPSPSHSSFTLDSSHTTSFLTSTNGTNVLRLQKPAGQAVQYKKGLQYTFTQSKPQHIQFKFASTNPDTQDSNLRIMDSLGNTVVLFRAGKGGLIRVNQKQMISFYNQSVSTDSNIKMTQIDLKLNWQENKIEIFVNQKYKDHCQFFNIGTLNVNKLLMYNLYESVSYWQDIVVCSEICYGFNWEKIGMIGVIGWVVLIVFIMY